MYMPKLNAVAMVVLTLAVIAGMGYFVLGRPASGVPDAAVPPRLLRNLADRDPDVGREAADALRSLGSKAIPSLEQAVSSADRVLADRAQKLLAELKPATKPLPVPVEAVLPEKVELHEFVLESRGGKVRAADLGGLWVQFRNNGSAPVLVGKGLTLEHPVAVFEVEDEKGRRVEVAADGVSTFDIEAIAAVRPHETEVLFEAGRRLVEAVSKPGTYRIRFAYDASEGGDYRRLVQASARGVLLPPARLVSQTLTVTVAD